MTAFLGNTSQPSIRPDANDYQTGFLLVTQFPQSKKEGKIGVIFHSFHSFLIDVPLIVSSKNIKENFFYILMNNQLQNRYY